MQHRIRRAASIGLLTISGSVMLCGCQSPPFFGGESASTSEPAAIREAFSISKDREPAQTDKFVSRGRETDSPLGRPAADPPRIQGQLQQAHDAVVRGRADDARRLYQQILDEQPNHPEAHHRLGILADRDGQYATAEKHYLRALRGRPTDADLLSDVGYSYFLQGRPMESERFLREALQVDPGHKHARDNLAVLFDRSKAESVLRTVQSQREADQTLAALFADGPTGGAMDLNSDTPPEGVDPNEWLRQKMAAARTSIPAAEPTREPIRPLPQRRPQVAYPTQPGRIPDEHLADALQEIDRSSQPRDPRMQPAQAWPTRNQQPSADPRALAEIPRSPARAPMAPDPRSTQVAYGPQTSPSSDVHHADFDSDSSIQTKRYDMNARDRMNPPDSMSSRQPIDARPEAPRWENIPQQNWSQVLPAAPTGPQYASRTPQGAIQQTDYTVARQAAEMGMQTGPGAVFPGLRSSENQQPTHQPRMMADGSAYPVIQPQASVPPRRELPGTNSQTRGVATPSWQDRPAAPDWNTQDQYASSNWNHPMETGAATPGQWPHANGPTNPNGMPVIQPNQPLQQPAGAPIERRYDQNGAFQQNSGQMDSQDATQNPPQYSRHTPGPLDAYDQQRQEHAATYNSDLQDMATQRGQWGQGSVNRPQIPAGMMVGPNDYHSYRPEDYNLRPETGAPDYRAGLGRDYGTGAVPVRFPGQ